MIDFVKLCKKMLQVFFLKSPLNQKLFVVKLDIKVLALNFIKQIWVYAPFFL